MDKPLLGKKIAILVANGFEEMAMTETQRALLALGATLRTISTEQGLVNGWLGKAWGHYFPVDCQVGDVLGADFDMLVLPGGERSVNKLKQTAHSRRIVGHFLDAGKPIAAIEQGVSLLAIPSKLKNRCVTATEDLHADLIAAGATIAEEPMVTAGAIVSARSVEQLEEFVAEVLRHFTENAQVRQAA